MLVYVAEDVEACYFALSITHRIEVLAFLDGFWALILTLIHLDVNLYVLP